MSVWRGTKNTKCHHPILACACRKSQQKVDKVDDIVAKRKKPDTNLPGQSVMNKPKASESINQQGL